MRKSIGARTRQREREHLFWAEITLRRTSLHLIDSMRLARSLGSPVEERNRTHAVNIIAAALYGVTQRQEEISDEI